MSSKANWADRLFGILLQVKRICEQSGITMFLYDDTALEAYGSQTLAPNVSVCIDIKDSEKFIAAVEENQSSNLRVEHLLNNPRLSLKGPGAIVYDPDTTDFNMFDFFYYNNNCLGVRVYYIAHMPDNGLSRRYVNAMLRGFNKKNERYFNLKDSKASKLTIPLEAMERTKGPEQVALYIHDLVLSKMSGDTERVRVARNTFDAELFNETANVQIEGQTFLIPKNAGEYFTRIYGAGWEYVSKDEYKEGRYRFRSALISWEDYKKAVPFDEQDYFSALREHYSAEREFKMYNRRQHKYFKLLKRTDDRIQLARQLEPRKQELISMKEAGDYEGLKVALEPYLKAIYENEKDRLGLCFDREIFELACLIIEQDYGVRYAERIRRLVYQEQKMDLQLKDYKGQNIDWKGNAIT